MFSPSHKNQGKTSWVFFFSFHCHQYTLFMFKAISRFFLTFLRSSYSFMTFISCLWADKWQCNWSCHLKLVYITCLFYTFSIGGYSVYHLNFSDKYWEPGRFIKIDSVDAGMALLPPSSFKNPIYVTSTAFSKQTGVISKRTLLSKGIP